MTKNKILTPHEESTLKENFPIYTKMRCTSMFHTLFKEFHYQQKLSQALQYIDYQPFKSALEWHDYSFFCQLLNSMPAERYKKLALLGNDYELIKLFIKSIIEDQNLNEKTIHACLDASTTISQIISDYPEIANSYIKEIYNEENVPKENYDNKLFISSHFKTLISQSDKIDQNIEKVSLQRKLPIEFDSELYVPVKKVKFSDESVKNELREDQLMLNNNSSDLIDLTIEAPDYVYNKDF